MNSTNQPSGPNTYVSFADYARKEVGSRHADITMPPALNHLEDIVRAFWDGEFEGNSFADREQKTAIARLTPPTGAIENVDDGRYYNDSGEFERTADGVAFAKDGYEIFRASWSYEPETRELMRWRLCNFEWVPEGMKPLRRKGSWPAFSYFAQAPISRYLENNDPAALKGFEYLAKLSIGRDDLDRWLEARDCAEVLDSGGADAGADTALRSKTRAYSEAKLEKWYRSFVAKHEKAKSIPSREEELAAAKREVNASVPRRAVRELRKELAPESWHKSGRRESIN